MNAIHRIQVAFPRIWHLAHRAHAGRHDALSERDQRVLAHLDLHPEPSRLAAHLGIAASTLSEHLGQLEERGLLTRRREPADRRRLRIALTDAGRATLGDSGPLDMLHLERALDRLGPEAQSVCDGLEALAQALEATR